MGPRVAEFEDAFAAHCGTRHAIAVSSGTAALHLTLLAVGCGPADEVVLPSLNFVAAANAIAHTGALPVFCDISGGTDLNLDTADLEQAIGPATKAIVVLHYGGYPCDMERVLEIARREQLVVIEDAAHATGATWRGQMCGTLGRAGCFSFFANKNLPVGEGGMIVTDEDDLASRVRLLRSHGMTTLTWARHQGHAHSYDVVSHGFNYRLDEMRAAIGLVQLGRLADANHARSLVAARYREAFDGVRGLRVALAAAEPDISPAHHLAVLILPEDGLQAPVRAFLGERGIQTSLHYPPIHRFSGYAGLARRNLPNTERLSRRIVTLPLYPHIRDEQVELVVASVLDAREHASRASATTSSY
jgi:dTDP-4-amino-4,6-dideoxygalactose transaminase